MGYKMGISHITHIPATTLRKKLCPVTAPPGGSVLQNNFLDVIPTYIDFVQTRRELVRIISTAILIETDLSDSLYIPSALGNLAER